MTGSRKRAAYVQLRADYFGRGFDEGVVHALLGAGYEVDVFAPGGALPQDVFPPEVQRLEIEFRRSWLLRNVGRPRWRRYDLFLGNPDLGTAVAAVLARAAGRPFVNVCDEIYVGGYEGSAIGYWKPLARWSARQARFTIITDLLRAELQRRYASLPMDHRFVPYPPCFLGPYCGPTRADVRRQLGIDDAERVVSATGALTEANGVHWLFETLDRLNGSLLIQPGNRPNRIIESLLARVDHVRYFPNREPWRRAAEITRAADVSAVFYLSSFPEFQTMGVSSQKLVTSLWLGIPVVATAQPSFEFIRASGCGELISDANAFPQAVERICANYERYVEGTKRAMSEHVRGREKFEALTAALGDLARGRLASA